MNLATAGTAALALALLGCGRSEPEPTGSGAFRFRDVTAACGIRFVHEHGGKGLRQFPETMGGGAAWLDYDGDADVDLFLVQSGPLPDDKQAPRAANALYRNDGGSFVDVTAGAGAAASTGYGQGVAAGDADSDGDPDLYVTNFGPNVLLENVGGGSFADVTKRAGVGDPRWSASAAFFDMDADGDLDLYVVNYVVYSLADARNAAAGKGYPAYPHPDKFRSAPDVLFRNDGHGAFLDVTEAAGIRDVDGKGLGVATADLDEDGDQDVYVANDSTPNFLFRNEGGGRFSNHTVASNAGYNADGQTQAGMGVGVADVDGDLALDLFVTNLDNETNTLYVNQGDSSFLDLTFERGLAQSSLPFVGFGTGFLDADLDGDADLLVGNGHIIDNIDSLDPVSGSTYRQRCLMYENDGSGSFREEGAALAPALAEPRVVRAAAFADFDDDGDRDVLLAQNAGPAVLIRNETPRRGHFLQLRVLGASGADAIGAEVVAHTGGRAIRTLVLASSSYCSSNDPRVALGVPTERVERLEVRWPGGARRVLNDVAADRRLVIRPDGDAVELPLGREP